MRVAVVGSTGHTGTQVVSQALARGHQVIAVARHPHVAARQDARLVSMAGDVLDQNSMIRALADAEAVVSALGIGASRNPTVVYSQGTANILRAMDAHAIRKLAVISAAPVAPQTEQPLLQRRIIMPILERIFGATYDDMRRMEAELDRSELGLRPRSGVIDDGSAPSLDMLGDGSDSFRRGARYGCVRLSDRGGRVEELAA